MVERADTTMVRARNSVCNSASVMAGLISTRPEQILVRPQNRTAVAADPARRHRPGLTHPPQKLHGRGWADLIAGGRLSD
jgi:hypothetical protein